MWMTFAIIIIKQIITVEKLCHQSVTTVKEENEGILLQTFNDFFSLIWGLK